MDHSLTSGSMQGFYFWLEEVTRAYTQKQLLKFIRSIVQRRKEMKKSLPYVLSLLVVVSMVLSACAAAPATQAPATEAAPKFTCALITPNPLGDRSFIDASARGIKKANEELPVKCDI